MTIATHNLGFPRIGGKRELKRAIEAYWKGSLPGEALEDEARRLRHRHWLLQKEAGIGLIPSNDFSFYDQMLDMSCLLGVVPPRFGWQGGAVDLPLLFSIARGRKEEEPCGCGGHHAASGTEQPPAVASEMTKWFDTNYHYIVPEFRSGTRFALSTEKPFTEFAEALELGITTKPVLVGPLSYLFLGKSQEEGFDRLSLLGQLLPVYGEILRRLASQGAQWVQLDEPILALDLDGSWKEAFGKAYATLREAAPGLKLLVATYFGDLGENTPLAASLPVDALHVDLTRSENPEAALGALLAEPSFSRSGGKALSLGVVDGRNIWRNDFARSLALLKPALEGDREIWIAPSCSLLHTPVTLRHEEALAADLKEWLAFAEEKLHEVVTLARLAALTASGVAPAGEEWEANQRANRARRESARIHHAAVKARSAAVTPEQSQRHAPFGERRLKQQAALQLPGFPTTTIGSFPQTAEIRSARARWKKGTLSDADYDAFLKDETARCIRLQEELGLDVLVHGEFERNDMVEYFGENLEGFAFTANGWVQSYGTRCVKPPIIFGDVSRPRPMTVEWATYAQSLTQRPVKGMLTGPITILQWSFVRDDQPRRETARQIGLAVRDEVLDLEAAGIRVIQIDEPALREGLPLRRADWAAYLAWATEAFRLSAAGVRDETQIHTHMCYCEFNDIIDSIAALDADVISIETSRSNMELLEAFATFHYPNEVGPGVWDIHSPRVPATAEMTALLRKAAEVLPKENLWVNPDCGLKTRGWEETIASLRNLVEAARTLRKEG